MAMSFGAFLIMVFLFGITDASADKETKHFTIEEREAQSPLGVSILAVGVNSSVGRLLLIRRDADLCAIRFTEFHRGHDAKPPAWFHSGEESFYAEYDWYLPGPNGQFSGTNVEVETGHRKVDKQPLLGFGRLGFQLGTAAVECGSLTPSWFYPTGVSFRVGTQFDHDLELAPIQWTELSQINLRDLIWYRYNESQQDTFVPLKELP